MLKVLSVVITFPLRSPVPGKGYKPCPPTLRRCPQGEAACADIRRKVPGAVVDTLALDLESIDSIRGFVKSFRQTSLPLHVLVNNAGEQTCQERTVYIYSAPPPSNKGLNPVP